MAKTNAEKQAEFRKKMKSKGFKQKLVWVDHEGLQVHADDEYGAGKRPRVNANIFKKELKKLTDTMLDDYTEEMLAELLSNAKTIAAAYARMDAMAEDEAKRNAQRTKRNAAKFRN